MPSVEPAEAGPCAPSPALLTIAALHSVDSATPALAWQSTYKGLEVALIESIVFIQILE